MTGFDLSAAAVGDAIPAFNLPALSRTTLALFAAASGDHNPIHIDIDYAKRAGMSDVFGHGMLGMAYMSRLVTDIAPIEKIRDFGTRFTNITQIHAELALQGWVTEITQVEGIQQVRLELIVKDQNNDVKLQGYAVIAI